jgi:hypothetical protein
MVSATVKARLFRSSSSSYALGIIHVQTSEENERLGAELALLRVVNTETKPSRTVANVMIDREQITALVKALTEALGEPSPIDG